MDTTNNIKIITTGGTIDKVYFDAKSEFQVGDSEIALMLQRANVQFEFSIFPLMHKDSLEFTDEDRDLVFNTVSNEDCKHILITHGTDTMIETAQRLTSISDKVIVLTGSLAPTRFRETDAVFNIGFALAALQTLPTGIYIAMNGKIFNPNQVTKDQEQRCFKAD